MKAKFNNNFVRYFCPGCNGYHIVPTAPKGENGTDQPPTWTANFDPELPTLSPSILLNSHKPESRCHHFIRNGMIEYCSDSFHQYAGQSIPLPEIEEERYGI